MIPFIKQINPFKAFEKILQMYLSEPSIKDLEKRWREPHRYYHNIDHLILILKDIEKDIDFKHLSIYEKHAILLAAFFHDAVYDPKKDDNEEKSVKIFRFAFKNTDPKMTSTVSDLIMVTKYRKRPITKLKRILWDADNAGFKKGYSWLFKTEKLIQKEYSYLPKEKFREGKIKFLETNFGLFGAQADKDLQKLIDYYKDKF